MFEMLIRIIAKVMKKARLSSVHHSYIDSTSKIEAGSSFYQSTLNKFSFCGYDCDVYHATIGSFTSIANQVVIGGARHPMEWVGMSPVFYEGRDSIKEKFSEHSLEASPKTIVGNDVWIGRSAIVLSGVNVGNGAVIGAGAVVTKDVPAYGIVAGNPAKLIRFRFEKDTINELEEINWWALEEEVIVKLAEHIKNPQKFIAVYREISRQNK